MRTLGWFTFLLVAACVGLGALDGTLPSLGVDEKMVQRVCQDYLRGSSTLLPGYYLPRPVIERVKAMTGPQKAAAVTEALRLAKTVVSTPGFAKAHETYITSELHAVNHGIDVNASAQKQQQRMMDNPEGELKNVMAVAGAQVAESFRKMDKNVLKMMLDQDLPDGDAKLKKIAPLLDSNFEEFRRQYSLWKSASMGGPSTEEGFQAALGKGASEKDRQKQVDEQRAWNQYNLKSALARRLDDFIALASSVDFTAQTRQASGKALFVNPEYERKRSEWKALYRAGKEPVGAALEFARQWRKEL